MVTVSVSKIITIIVLLISAVVMVKQFLAIKVLRKLIKISDDYAVTPEVVRVIMNNSENAEEMYETLDKLVAELELQVISYGGSADEEESEPPPKNKIGFDIYG